MVWHELLEANQRCRWRSHRDVAPGSSSRTLQANGAGEGDQREREREAAEWRGRGNTERANFSAP